jgi:Fic family protein
MLFRIPTLTGKTIAVIKRIDDIRKELSYATHSPRRWSGALRRTTFARAIQGSNSIEGYNVTFEDAVAAVDGAEPIDANEETRSAIGGYRAALTYILQLSDDPYFGYHESFLRGLHYMMIGYDLSKHPGRWRPGTIFVRREPSNEIVYEGPDAGLIPELMSELIEALRNDPDNTPMVVRAAMAHLNLVMIHPFSDGNGRMARALQTLVLAREGILEPTFSSIEEYLGRNTTDYYAVLGEVGAGKWQPFRDATPWVRFCLTAQFRQATTLLRRMKEFDRLWGELELEIKHRGLPDRTLLALSDAAVVGTVSAAMYRPAADVSGQVASKDLALLVRAGLLKPRGERRGRSYTAAQALLAIRAKTREPRGQNEDPFADGVSIDEGT